MATYTITKHIDESFVTINATVLVLEFDLGNFISDLNEYEERSKK